MDTTTEKHDLFHAFNQNPNIYFESQHPDEKVFLLLRAHPVTQLGWIINAVLFIILIIFLNFLAPLILSLSQIFFFNIFFLAIVFAYAWYNFLLWFFNVGIITNERVVDIDFHGILYKEVTMTKLEKIEDVTSKSLGYFGALFDYGNVFVQTAGSEVNIEFHRVPHPGQVVSLINQLMP